MKKLLILTFVFVFFVFPSSAFAGDAAIIIFKSGAKITLKNGFKQIETGISKIKSKSSNNQYVKIDLSGSPFYLNLDSVAIVCRDSCSSMELVLAKKEKS